MGDGTLNDSLYTMYSATGMSMREPVMYKIDTFEDKGEETEAVMTPKDNWSLSARALRLELDGELEYLSSRDKKFYKVVRDGNRIIVNNVSRNVIAFIREHKGNTYIRYRDKSLYRSVLRDYANDIGAVAVPSETLGRYRHEVNWHWDQHTNEYYLNNVRSYLRERGKHNR